MVLTVLFRKEFDISGCADVSIEAVYLHKNSAEHERDALNRSANRNGINHIEYACTEVPYLDHALIQPVSYLGDRVVCRGCDRSLPVTFFRPLSHSLRSEYCEDCMAGIQRNRKKKNQEKIAKRKERMALAGGDFLPSDKERYVEQYGEQCAKCHTTERLEYDHIVPIAHEGKSTLDNMQILCTTCHSEKGESHTSYLS
jgi:5-methylcytosine-specific restriction endonuclease McrA